MPIKYHQTSQEFHLYNDHISYIIKLLRNGQLGQLYFGARVPDRADHGLFGRKWLPTDDELRLR